MVFIPLPETGYGIKKVSPLGLDTVISVKSKVISPTITISLKVGHATGQ